MRYMYNETELQHHGVKGMKWGVRKSEKKVNSMYKKLGRLQGKTDYYDNVAQKTVDRNSQRAKRLSAKSDLARNNQKYAKSFRLHARALAAQRSADLAGLEQQYIADRYRYKSELMKAKIKDYAKKHPDSMKLGSKKANDIVSKCRDKSYNNQVLAAKAVGAAAVALWGVRVGLNVASMATQKNKQ